jgi:hypothetical protein
MQRMTSTQEALEALRNFIEYNGGSINVRDMRAFYSVSSYSSSSFRPSLKICIENCENKQLVCIEDRIYSTVSTIQGLSFLYDYVSSHGGSIIAANSMNHFYYTHECCRGVFRPNLKKCIERYGSDLSNPAYLVWRDGHVCIPLTITQAMQLLYLYVIRNGGSMNATMMGHFYAEHENCRDVFTRPISKCIQNHGGLLLWHNSNIVAYLGLPNKPRSSVASVIPQDEVSMQTPPKTPRSQGDGIDFIVSGNATLSAIGKDTMPSESVDERRSTTVDTALAGENALTLSGGTKDIFGALRAEDRDAPPLPPRVGAAGDVESPQRSIGPSNSPDLSGDSDSPPTRREEKAQGKLGL